MKLLLTSAGLTNKTLWKKFIELSQKEPGDTKLTFLGTASKGEKDTSFIQEVLENLKKGGIRQISVVDISNSKDPWKNILLQSDVIWVEGGNTFYLLDEIRKSGLIDEFKGILGNKLYVGVSAGSILVTPTIAIAGVEPADPNTIHMTDFSAVGWVNFEVSPHTPDIVPLNNVKDYAKQSGRKIYAFDDNTAILYVDGKVETIGDGFCQLI